MQSSQSDHIEFQKLLICRFSRSAISEAWENHLVENSLTVTEIWGQHVAQLAVDPLDRPIPYSLS
jgi:hypothetical protein